LKDLSKLIVNMVEEHDFKRYCNRFIFSKCKNETKEEVLVKGKSLVKIFEVGFLDVHSYKVHIYDVYQKLV